MKTITNKILIFFFLGIVTFCIVQLSFSSKNNWFEKRITFICNAFSKKKSGDEYQKIIYLTAKDITDASIRDKSGYVIVQSCTCIIKEDISKVPFHPDSSAIFIAADNVVLQGDGHYIKQADPTIKHTIAIQVKEGCKNIQIQNLTLNNFSGGGIWFTGGNEHITVKEVKVVNCGYNGLTSLDVKSLGPKVPSALSYGILLEGGSKSLIKDAHISNCTFTECGILRKGTIQYDSACSALQVYQASDVTISGCVIDGCVGRDLSYGITLVGISNVLVSDVIITDIISSGSAQSIYHYDIGGKMEKTLDTSVFSQVPESSYEYLLDTHGVPTHASILDDHEYPIEANHLKNIIPNHAENEQALFEEHTWKEFRTLFRLVCHNSDKISKTSAIYAKWVELFCQNVLGVKVKVVGGFANLYLSGDIPLPAHRDAYGKWVFGLSFGQARTFEFIPDNKKSGIVSYQLESGDVFLFSPEVNKTHQHRMLAEPDRKGRRINITYFLEVLPGQESKKLLQQPQISTKNYPTFKEAVEFYSQSRENEN